MSAQSRILARALGIGEREVGRIGCAAHVHDVGKIIVSPEILEKPGRLAPCEFEEIQRHSVFGARLVASLGDPAMTKIVRHHHERLDGSGYPDRLRGEEIPLGSRIIAVADTFDALTSRRPYREALTPAEAIRVIESEAGTTLDARVVGAFVG